MARLGLKSVLAATYCIVFAHCVQASPHLQLRLKDISVQLQVQPFSLSIRHLKNTVLRVEASAGPLSGNTGLVSSLPFDSLEQDGPTTAVARCGSSCALTVRIEGTEHITLALLNTGAPRSGFNFKDQGEHYFGVWEHPFNGRIDNRGVSAEYSPIRERLMNSAPNARSPFYFTDRGYAVGVRSDRAGAFSFAMNQETQFLFESDQLDVDIFLATAPSRLFELYNMAREPVRVPPAWAFGTWWWRDDLNKPLSNGARNGVENLLSDARKLEELGIRASGFIVDRPYGTGSRGWGNFDFAESFGPAKEAFSELGNRGYRLLLWLANRSAASMYEQGKKEGYLFFPERPESEWPALDLRQEAAKNWFHTRLQQLFLPAVVGAKIDRGDEDELPRSLENQFAQLNASTIADAFRASRGEDFFLISRNLHEGGRASSAVWSGDPMGSFQGLTETLKAGLRSGLAGHPLWGSDVGGYKGAPSAELFARWLALGAVSPIMETLIVHQNKLLWNDYGPELPRLAKHFANLHHNLIPYLYAQALQSAKSGLPFMRPLFLEFPSDSVARSLWDEYLLGDAFLVAPALVEGARERHVYFPKGVWCEYPACTRAFHGPTTATIPTPLDYIPLFLRQGYPILTGDIVRANFVGEPWSPSQRVELFPPPSGSHSYGLFTAQGSKELVVECSAQKVRVKIPTLEIQAGALLRGDARDLLISYR